MKHLLLLTLLIRLCNCNNHSKQHELSSNQDQVIVDKKTKGETSTTPNKNDSIQYEIILDKEIYSIDEPIVVTLVAKNTTAKELKIWIDAGMYPTGSELNILDSSGSSIVREHWAIMNSQTSSQEESENFKTAILPNQEFRKEYNLLSIIQLKEKFTKGTYEINYNNAEPIWFEIK